MDADNFIGMNYSDYQKYRSDLILFGSAVCWRPKDGTAQYIPVQEFFIETINAKGSDMDGMQPGPIFNKKIVKQGIINEIVVEVSVDDLDSKSKMANDLIREGWDMHLHIKGKDEINPYQEIYVMCFTRNWTTP